MGETRRFPSPFEIPTLPGTEGWERMYHYGWQFTGARREFEEKMFWLWDAMHFPEPMYPIESYVEQVCLTALNAYQTRVFAFPVTNGVEGRLVNGYMFGAFRGTDSREIEKRGPIFGKRSGYFFQNWNELYEAKWIPKMKALIEELKQIEFKELPEFESDAVALNWEEGLSGYVLLENFHKLQANLQRAWQYHWEFNPLVYLAYLTFYELCSTVFPGIKYSTIAKMVAGHENLVMYRPDEELCKLSRLAFELGIKDLFKDEEQPDRLFSMLKATEEGRRWLEAFEGAKDPWFYVSTGSGFNPAAPTWIDDLSIPLGYIRGYIERLEKGETIERPVAELAKERDRIVGEYRELLRNEEDRAAFDQCYQTLVTTFPYAENHIFYIEHWHHTIFWQKIRELGSVLKGAGFLNEVTDIYYFNASDITDMLTEYALNWSGGAGPSFPARGPSYWPEEAEWRKGVMQTFREWSPPPALGIPPKEITDPMFMHLWGITTETIDSWLSAGEGTVEEPDQLKGFPASTGVARGKARVVLSISELGDIGKDEVLICPMTSPAWSPVFGRLKAIVTDIGGMSSHAGIVAREYGIPCVVATGFATKIIRTGDTVEVNGGEGVVKIIK